MKKIAVYTCITGNYDELNEIKKMEKEIDYYCFTNNHNITSNTWKVIYIENDGLDNQRLSRKIKMLGHPIINDNYDISMWMDASVVFQKSIVKFIRTYCNFDKAPFTSFVHSERDCIYEEAKACVKLKKDGKEIIQKQINYYEKNKFPHHYGLYEMTVFVKKHNDPIVKKTMEMWFDMVCKWSKRDQLSFMWCIYHTHMKITPIHLNVFDNNWFTWISHFTTPMVKDCRVYCGSAEEEAHLYNWNYDSLISYEQKTNRKYLLSFPVLRNTHEIKIDLDFPPSAHIINISCDFSYQLFQYENFDEEKYATVATYLVLTGDFSKNQEITIEFTLDIFQGAQFMQKCKEMQVCISENNQLLSDNELLKKQNNQLKQNYENILKTSSWKITAPFRKFADICRSFKK